MRKNRVADRPFRTRMHSMNRPTTFQRIAEAIEWLAAHQEQQPDLAAMAKATGMSPHHLQRTFQQWAGVSPKQFVSALTREAALARLRRGESVLDAALGAGLSGPGRLHDLLVSTDALTPGQVRTAGTGVTIRYGFGTSPFGPALIAWTDRGINFLGFCNDVPHGAGQQDLERRWPGARYVRDDGAALEWLDRVFAGTRTAPLPVWLRGSPFQLKVWEALLQIPEDANASYGRIAAHIGRPGASRAVGNAVGENPIAWLIPCHRVIRQTGALGGYHWGMATKAAMLGFEHAAAELNRAS
jgi:AraC family transcriptional regulator of adaptative response/methylated-DNA-[protein]-cysteine methyltransferase